ncbi:MAG: ATP-binding cassette domain-containing protein [Leptospirales bacterium]|nr:ATP-binding cassette domain-containing protein [Leptospirales bacterium]
MIEFVDVCKSFAGVPVLKDLSFKIRSGETFVIIGMSGTGKTVTLKNISGLEEPDSGEVLIDGVRMNGASAKVKKKLRSMMGMVFQSGAMLNWLPVGENIALPLKERSHGKIFSQSEIDSLVREKLGILGLHDAIHKMPSDISGGMKKRACLARVLIRNPDIILYDEPTSGLDPVMSSHINVLIKKMQADFGVTSVVVTHDMESAYFLADRIAVLYKGEIIQCGSPEEIKNSSNPVVAQFVNGKIDGPIVVN